MKQLNERNALNEAIVQLEKLQAEQLKDLKDQFHKTFDSFKPGKFFINSLKEVTGSKDSKNSIVNTGLSLAVGYISKLLLAQASRNPVNKVIGTVLVYGLTNLITKHPDKIKDLGHKALSLFRKKPDMQQEEEVLS